MGAIITPAQFAVKSLIPMSFNDPIFNGIVNGTNYITLGNGQNLTLLSFSDGYASGNQIITCDGNSPGNIITKCRFDSREGPRLDASGPYTFDQCWINCVGQGTDHADGIQYYSPGGNTQIHIKNTAFRAYTVSEATSIYGAGFIDSDSFFYADSVQGTVTFENVLIWGGSRGVAIYADTGTTHISFNNVYFAASPNGSGWQFYDYDIRATGGTLVVDRWTNVYDATVVNGVIIPGAALSSP